ncbi:glycosyltransferase [Bacteroidota bacterium]
MDYILIAFAIISVLYFIIVFSFLIGWIKIKEFNNDMITTSIPLSIVIPFRNEKNNIEHIINDIQNQTYSKEDFELILINDHSNDSSVEVINTLELNNIKIKILNLENDKGKKAALRYGIESSNNDLIVTTDADCRVGKDWLRSIAAYYLKYKPDVIVGPVLYKEGKGFLNHFYNLEFLSLIASGAGAIGISKPIMANGANLIFDKKVYHELNLKNSIASGDDVFFIHGAKKLYKKSIRFLKSKDAVVLTNAPKNIQEFIQQRIRWSSKSVYYHDFETLLVAWVIFLFNLMIVLLVIMGILHSFSLLLALMALLAKLIIDSPLLFMSSKFFKRLDLMKSYLPAQLLYPFYIVTIIFIGIFYKKTWKERSIK